MYIIVQLYGVLYVLIETNICS